MTPRKRAREHMPAAVSDALGAQRLHKAYDARPPYQRNDYLRWIKGAKTAKTRDKRIQQMLAELERGDVYMKMSWKAGSKKPSQRRAQSSSRGLTRRRAP